MLVFGICLVFGATLSSALLWSTAIGFYLHLVLALLFLFAAIVSKESINIFRMACCGVEMLMCTMLYNINQESLPAIGFILFLREVNTIIFLAMRDK